MTGLTGKNYREESGEIVNDVLDWERRSGATFEADKPPNIRFAPKVHKPDQGFFIIKGQSVVPRDRVQVSDVLMDMRLKYEEHITGAASKGLERWSLANFAPSL